LEDDMGLKRRTSQALHEEAHRHASAARAFHAGLVAESQRHLHVLAAFSRHLNILREERRQITEKLASADACCRELANLRRLREPWRETYADFRRSLRRARTLFHRLASSSRRKPIGG
jgi:hypothetical protein